MNARSPARAPFATPTITPQPLHLCASTLMALRSHPRTSPLQIAVCVCVCVCARGVYLEPLEEEPAGVALVRGVGGPHDADDAARVCKVLLAAEAAKAEAHRRCCRRGEVGRAQEAPEHFGGGVALGGA